MFSGTLLAQVINLLSYPIIARQYSPGEMGAFTVFITTASIAGAVACGRFDAVIQAAKYYERFAVFAVSQRFTRVISIAVAVVYGAVALLTGQNNPELISLALALSIFLTGYCNAASLFLLKDEEYKLGATSVVARTLLTAFPQIGFFYVLPSFAGLIAGFGTGYLAQALFLHWAIRSRSRWRRATRQQLGYAIRRYKIYLIVDVPSQLLSILALTSLSYCVLFLFTEEDVGYYSVSYRLAALPLSVIAGSLSQVFFQKGARAFRETGVFWDELRFNVAAALGLSLCIYSVAIIGAVPLTRIYLGPQWLPAADVLVYLAPMLGVRFVSGTIASMPLIIGKPKLLLIKNVFLLGALVAAFLVAWAETLSLADYLILNTVLTGAVEATFVVFVVWYTKRHYASLPPQVISQGS